MVGGIDGVGGIEMTEDLGRLNLGQYVSAKRRAKLDEVKEYEKKYLVRLVKARPKKSKARPKKSSSKKLDHDLISGRLNLSKHVDKKRKELLKKARKK